MDGAGPPIAPPGLSGDPAAGARAIADERGQFGRDFADQRNGDRLTGQERAELQRQQAQAFQENVQLRRQLAQEYAAAVRNGAQLPANASATLRNELKADLEQFKVEFRLGRDEWQKLRDQWIADRDALTPEEWTQRRLDWFAFRDAWIDRQRQFAQARADD
jgi:hypothetical protein